jgi:hypothetical protein
LCKITKYSSRKVSIFALIKYLFPLQEKNASVKLEDKQLQWFNHVKRPDRTMILRRVLELKFKEKRPCDDPEQDGSARYQKTSRTEE